MKTTLEWLVSRLKALGIQTITYKYPVSRLMQNKWNLTFLERFRKIKSRRTHLWVIWEPSVPFDLFHCKNHFITLNYHYRYSFHPNTTVVKKTIKKKKKHTKWSLTPTGADLFKTLQFSMPFLVTIFFGSEAQRDLTLPAVHSCLHLLFASITAVPAVLPDTDIFPIKLGPACEWWWGWRCSKFQHFCSKLLPESLLGVWLCPAGVTRHLVQLLVENEAVHHGNVHKMVKVLYHFIVLWRTL